MAYGDASREDAELTVEFGESLLEAALAGLVGLGAGDAVGVGRWLL